MSSDVRQRFVEGDVIVHDVYSQSLLRAQLVILWSFFQRRMTTLDNKTLLHDLNSAVRTECI
jgi:hypothetical protein